MPARLRKQVFGLYTPTLSSARMMAWSATVRSVTPPMPAATYQTVSQWLQIEMDDHVHLGATITFPSKDGTTRAPGRSRSTSATVCARALR